MNPDSPKATRSLVLRVCQIPPPRHGKGEKGRLAEALPQWGIMFIAVEQPFCKGEMGEILRSEPGFEGKVMAYLQQRFQALVEKASKAKNNHEAASCREFLAVVYRKVWLCSVVPGFLVEIQRFRAWCETGDRI